MVFAEEHADLLWLLFTTSCCLQLVIIARLTPVEMLMLLLLLLGRVFSLPMGNSDQVHITSKISPATAMNKPRCVTAVSEPSNDLSFDHFSPGSKRPPAPFLWADASKKEVCNRRPFSWRVIAVDIYFLTRRREVAFSPLHRV